MNSKNILIISNKSDITTDLVVKKLIEKGIPYLRFNTEDFPSSIIGQISLNNNEFESYLKTEKLELRFDDINSIWYRRPKLSDISKKRLSTEDATFVSRETNSFLMNLWAIFEEKTWVNNPFSLFKVERKAYQLKMAKKNNMTIPKTLISNNIDDIQNFISSFNKKVIAKPISHGGYGNNNEFAIYTADLECEKFKLEESLVKVSPFILQEKINKNFDVRISVFGKNLFAHKIIPKDDIQSSIDWRIYKPNEIKYEPISISINLKENIMNFMANLNLMFGAFDFIVDKNDQWYFIEINPNGQFAWLEIATGDKLILSLIELLLGNYD